MRNSPLLLGGPSRAPTRDCLRLALDDNMDMQETVLDVIATVSGKDRDALVPEAELVAHLGIDSSKGLQMLLELEDRLGIEIDDERVGRLATVADVLDAVREVAA